MQGLFPGLAPLLPFALLALQLVKQATGQSPIKRPADDRCGCQIFFLTTAFTVLVVLLHA